MFYCDPCAEKNRWPYSAFRSHGKCEICGELGGCNDVPSALSDEGALPSTYPEPCSVCSMSYDECTTQLPTKGACCGRCKYTETHRGMKTWESRLKQERLDFPVNTGKYWWNQLQQQQKKETTKVPRTQVPRIREEALGSDETIRLVFPDDTSVKVRYRETKGDIRITVEGEETHVKNHYGTGDDAITVLQIADRGTKEV